MHQHREPEENSRKFQTTSPDPLSTSFGSLLRQKGFIENPLRDPVSRKILASLTAAYEVNCEKWDREINENPPKKRGLLDRLMGVMPNENYRGYISREELQEIFKGSDSKKVQRTLAELNATGLIKILVEKIFGSPAPFEGGYYHECANGVVVTPLGREVLKSAEQPDMLPKVVGRRYSQSAAYMLFES